MDDYIKVDFEGLKLKIQSVHVPEGGFLLIALPRDAMPQEVNALRDALKRASEDIPCGKTVLVWREFYTRNITREELEEMKWRIEDLLKAYQ